MIKIYHNNSCSKSNCALNILEESGKEFEIVNYLETPPIADDLISIINKLGIKAHQLIRKNEAVYTDKYKGKELSEQEWVMLMVENPILIERPILVSGERAVIARPTEKIYDIL